jgi:hypothetical protein
LKNYGIFWQIIIKQINRMSNLKNNQTKLLTQKAGDTLSVAILRQVAVRFSESGQSKMASIVMQDIRDMSQKNNIE